MSSQIKIKKRWRRPYNPNRICLRFEYNSPESKWAVLAPNLVSAIWEITQYLREVERYQQTPDDIGTIRERIADILYDEGINLDIIYT